MLYLYALAEALQDVNGMCGVHGEPLQLVQLGGAQVVVGEAAGPPPLDGSVLRAQDALMRLLHDRSRALLPMRFGALTATREEMISSLERQRDLFARLAKVRGCEQMTVRAVIPVAPDSTDAPAASGTEYLRQRAVRQNPPELQLLARAADTLARDVRTETATVPGAPEIIGTIYHLLERHRAAEYRQLIDRTATGLVGVRVRISGPSPPYAFA